MRQGLKSGLSAAAIRRIVSRRLGAAGTGSVTPLRGGVFNTSYRITLADGQNVVLRAAPPPDRPLIGYERALLERETWFLERLRGFGIPVPRVLCADFSKTIVDRPYVILEHRKGYNAFYRSRGFTPAERTRFFSDLGRYARRIHSTPNPEGWFGCPPPFRPFRRWSDFIGFYTRLLQEDLRDLPRLPFPADVSLPGVARRMRGLLDEVASPRLVHGDLWLRNILTDGTGRITTLLDWDRGLWGDPDFEWILYGIDLPPAFRRAYGHAPLTPSRHARRLLYKACCGIQAALEDTVHFGLRAHPARLMETAAADLSELDRLL